ncbi:MAG: hypothetical protein ABR600_08355 [Actinomycetota bacterium]
MSDPRDLLEPVARRIEPSPNAFERLARRRARQHRSSRIGTAIVALLIGSAGLLGALRAFGHDHTSPAKGAVLDQRLSLWPDQWNLQRLQAFADEGQRTWMTYPAATARRFARTVLAWPSVTTDHVAAPGSGPVIVQLLSCPPDRCDRSLVITVTLARLTRADASGIWSVIRVGGTSLDLALSPGSNVVAGDDLRLRVGPRAAGRRVVAGWVASEQCTDDTGETVLQPAKGVASFNVAPKEARSISTQSTEGDSDSTTITCSTTITAGGGASQPPLARPARGYVYAYLSEPFTKHAGSELLGPVPRFIGPVRMIALTVVPVRFVPASQKSAVYPRGAFQSCPDVAGTHSLGPHARGGAVFTALRFTRAYLRGHEGVVAETQDPSVPQGAHWAITAKRGRWHLDGSDPARHDSLVRFGCGPAVANRSWAVRIDDGTKSASLDFTLYLVKRASGWKVWGSY